MSCGLSVIYSEPPSPPVFPFPLLLAVLSSTSQRTIKKFTYRISLSTLRAEARRQVSECFLFLFSSQFCQAHPREPSKSSRIASLRRLCEPRQAKWRGASSLRCGERGPALSLMSFTPGNDVWLPLKASGYII
jgi:hypothetical protein